MILIATALDQLLRAKVNLRLVFDAILDDGVIKLVAFGVPSPKRVRRKARSAGLQPELAEEMPIRILAPSSIPQLMSFKLFPWGVR